MAVDRKVATLMLTLSLMLLGLVAWFRFPVELVLSGFSPPFLYVEVPTLRSAPRDIEQRVGVSQIEHRRQLFARAIHVLADYAKRAIHAAQRFVRASARLAPLGAEVERAARDES